MATESTADKASFFDTDEFAVSAVYRKTGIPAKNINVIFDNEYFQVELGTGAEGTEPFALALASDIEDVAHTDRLQIDSVTYKIRGVEPDGLGLVRLKLEKQ